MRAMTLGLAVSAFALAVPGAAHVAAQEKLDIRLYERVLGVRGRAGDFTIETDRAEHHARHVVVSIGFLSGAIAGAIDQVTAILP